MGFFDKLLGKTAGEAPTTVLAPVSGEVIPLEEFPDAVFSQGILGQGCGIQPAAETIVSPFDGTVTQMTDTMHAIGVTSAGGVEVLIHVGVDTVEMAGNGFRSLVKQGQKLHTGDPLIQFDRDAIRAAGHADAVAIVVTNGDEFSAVELKRSGTVTAGELILEAVK